MKTSQIQEILKNACPTCQSKQSRLADMQFILRQILYGPHKMESAPYKKENADED